MIDALYERVAGRACPSTSSCAGSAACAPECPGSPTRSACGRSSASSSSTRGSTASAPTPSTAEYLIGSADLMPRNLDRRVEALVPVVDARLRARLAEVLELALADDVLAWELAADGTWSRVEGDDRASTPSCVSASSPSHARARPEARGPCWSASSSSHPDRRSSSPSSPTRRAACSPTSRSPTSSSPPYFDTPDLRLARAGASLRHRNDEGWMVKLPVGSDEGLTRVGAPVPGRGRGAAGGCRRPRRVRSRAARPCSSSPGSPPCAPRSRCATRRAPRSPRSTTTRCR